MNELLRQGGPHNIRHTGADQYTMSISIPADSDGMVARECPSGDCSPGYFKVKPGTGVTDGQTEAHCPYCHHKSEPSGFATKRQIEYAKQIVTREATDGIERMMKGALGLGSSGEKTIGGGLFSMKVSYKPGFPIRRPYGEVLRRDLTCPQCGLEHAVFGIATWCPDCGSDIFLEHVTKECEVVRLILADVENRRERLGARVAARDVENALEDVVSIFEAVLRTITRRYLRNEYSEEQVEEVSYSIDLCLKVIKDFYGRVFPISMETKEGQQ